MTDPRPFRFGIQLRGPLPGSTWAETARQVEDLGFSSLFLPDHFEDQLAPLPALAAAAAATTSLRLGALVLGNDYRHPVVVAKELATLDVLSGGRLEIGLGAGWMRSDYEAAGIPYDRPGVRIARLAESVEIVRRLLGPDPVDFEGEHYQIRGLDGQPKPVQDPPPILLGGGGPKMLALAASQADIVAVTANLRAGEVGPDAIADSLPAAYDAKIGWIREAAGSRLDEIELSSLTMAVEPTDDRATAAAAYAELFGMPADEITQAPAVLLGSVDDMCDTLVARRERWGFSYPVLHPPADGDLAALAPVVARLTGT